MLSAKWSPTSIFTKTTKKSSLSLGKPAEEQRIARSSFPPASRHYDLCPCTCVPDINSPLQADQSEYTISNKGFWSSRGVRTHWQVYKIVSEVGGAGGNCCFRRALGVEGLELPPLEWLNSSVSIIGSCPNFIAPLVIRCATIGLEYWPAAWSSLGVRAGESVATTSLCSSSGDLSTWLLRFR